MLRELINFTETLSDDFKSLGLSPKEGLHILFSIDEEGSLNTTASSIQFEYYSKKINDLSPLLTKCTSFQENAWCVDTNKCFDLPMKAIHSCSCVCVAFKRENIDGGDKFKANEKAGKSQLEERFDNYFSKAFEYIPEDWNYLKAVEQFKSLFINKTWKIILDDIVLQRNTQFNILSQQNNRIDEDLKNTTDKETKLLLKEKQKDLQIELTKYQPLSDSDYILFYIDLPFEEYKTVHGKYLDDKLFNTAEYNTEPDEDGIIWGTNNFQNGFNSNMPFLKHRTASFDISGRITNIDARLLYEFSKVLPRKKLPNPLPIFIYADELLEKDFIALCSENEERLSFREIIESLYKEHKNAFQNYYLLNWTNTQKGIVFNDYDFVSKFEYQLNDIVGWEVKNFFDIHEKANNGAVKKRPNFHLKTIFELEDTVLKYLIQNKYHRVDYFAEIKKDDYDNRDMTFLSYCKYRKAIYDYVYKSNKNVIGGKEFDEMVFNGIRDDLKNSNEYGIKLKLNYWYSLYDKFHNSNNTNTMASKLNDYQSFIDKLLEDKADLNEATDEQFAFAAGQVIYYLLDKSKSDDTSYRLMEPYLQKTSCAALQENIVEDFKRYKHENFSRNYTKVAAFVLSYETKQNLKKLQPQLLSGLFAKNKLYSNKNQENE